VPRSKYTKTPGPLPSSEQIARETFRFDEIAQRELLALLPLQFQQLPLPDNFLDKLEDAVQLETVADFVVAYTEEQIQFYLTVRSVRVGSPANPANVKAAIRKLRTALKPFVAGWVDDETATIIPDDLDRRLAERERELAGMHPPPFKRRALGFLCQTIGALLKECASVHRMAFEERDAIRYVATALDYAGIEHSYSTENPSRFAALVFPKAEIPHGPSRQSKG
jgi:hypothetical protein